MSTAREGFQTFEVRGEAGAAEKNIPALRDAMRELGVDGLLVPHDDEYLNEYTPPQFERLCWASGFSGSAGSLLVMRERAVLFIDSRYTEQARLETPDTIFDYEDYRGTPPAEWLTRNTGAVSRLAYCNKLHTRAEIEKFELIHGLELVSLDEHPADALWDDRPAGRSSPPHIHAIEYAGETTKARRMRVAERLQGADCTVFTNPNASAWLLNLRGEDVPNTPVALCQTVLHSDGSAAVFFDGHDIPDDVRAHLGDSVLIADNLEFADYLANIGRDGKTVLLDPASCPDFVWQTLARAGAAIRNGSDPLIPLRGVKNEIEIAAARNAHVKDGVAMVKFMRWLDESWANDVSEIDAVRRLEAFRAEDEAMLGPSFDTISGSGPNGAIIHYRVSEASDRKLQDGDLFLVDSGGQYFGATTDITRTMPLGQQNDERRDRYTRVLKGHIALARAVFPTGTTGYQLDMLARQPLWAIGLDYAHGTGHGVGTYLGVHEGPQSIAKRASTSPFKPGMTITIEPGFYVEGDYGIRIENIAVVVESELPGMLCFEALTLAPIDTSMVVVDLLTSEELDWLNTYHETVREKLAPRLESEDVNWLNRATLPIGV